MFATNPWPLIVRSVEQRCPEDSRSAAHALVQQARELYGAATEGDVAAAKPLLLYYSFLNLAKAFILTQAARSDVEAAKHGLSERLRAGRQEIRDAFLDASPTAPKQINVFDEFHRTIGGTALTMKTPLDLPKLLPQIVPGHRLWTSASHRRERFISVERVEFVEDRTAKEVWLRLFMFADDLKRVKLNPTGFLSSSGLVSQFVQVQSDDAVEKRRLLCFEQSGATKYQKRPLEALASLVLAIKPMLWATVSTMPPQYRRYYVYCVPAAEQAQVVRQLASIFAIMYYLGSVTRYRPHHFDAILRGKWGPFVEAFLNDQPAQFLYLMASEFAQQEVARASIV